MNRQERRAVGGRWNEHVNRSADGGKWNEQADRLESGADGMNRQTD